MDVPTRQSDHRIGPASGQVPSERVHQFQHYIHGVPLPWHHPAAQHTEQQQQSQQAAILTLGDVCPPPDHAGTDLGPQQALHR